MLPPRILAIIKAIRWWRYVEKYNEQSGLRDLCRRLIACCGTAVLSGPFKGLKLTEESLLFSCNMAGLLGSYELELHPWFQELQPGDFDQVLDIGAAAGYYAVGLAVRTGGRVDAYDPSPKARRICRAVARLNGVSSLLETHYYCSQSTLLKLRGRRCFILSDCEGFEISLFSEDVIRALAKSKIIIELHDGSTPTGTTRAILQSRFTLTHKVEFVKFQQRNLQEFSEFGCLRTLGADAQRVISEEGRTDEGWLIAVPLDKSAEENRPAV